MKRVTTSLLVAACLVAFAASGAFAQLSAGPRITTFGSFMQDVAYDPGHDAYLYVGQSAPNPNGAISGVFIDAVSRAAGAPFLMHLSAAGSEGIRAVYSPDVSDGAGGLGAFVVMWFEQNTLGGSGPLQVQIVAYPGRLVEPRLTLVSSTFQIFNISGAYSPVDRVFLFAWGETDSQATKSVRLDLNAQPVGPITTLSQPRSSSCNFEFSYDCMDVTTVWNQRTNEFGLLFRDGPVDDLTLTRVATNGAIVGRTVLVTLNALSSLEINAVTSNYVAVWTSASTFGSTMSRAELDPAGNVLGTGTITGISGLPFLVALGFQPVSNTFLLTGGQAMVELDSHGVQLSAAVPLPVLSQFPRAAARPASAEWMVGIAGLGQIVTTGTRLCSTPDPFAAMGGGTCFNGGWYPPTVIAPSTPPPPPPPSGGCVTPDPFTAFGGGTCFNGGWYPPGANAAPPPPPPPPLPPPGPGGCLTPDPFVAFGGGTCFNGGWYFRS